MIGHAGQLDALLAPNHRRTCRPPADHPAVARHDCPRKGKHWSTKAVVTKKRLPHNTHHTKPEGRIAQNVVRTTTTHITQFARNIAAVFLKKKVRRPTRKLQQLFKRTSVTDTNTVLDTRPTTLCNTGNTLDGCSRFSFNLLFLFLALRTHGPLKQCRLDFLPHCA